MSPLALDYAARAEAAGRLAPPPTLELAYGPDGGQRLDVYAPPGARDLPVLLFLHGGAWIDGHLGWLRFMAPAVLANPAILVAATYRLAPRHRWPAQREDALAALAFTRAEARGWGGGPGRVAVGGHSAGGHLAAFAALDAQVPCFPVSAPFDLRHGDLPAADDRSRVRRFLLDRAEDEADATPLLYADRARAPWHLLWGERDLPHVRASGEAMAARLGGRATATVLPGASHFDTHLSLGDPASPWHARLRDAWSRVPA